MPRSTDRIITTHAGSLPRPEDVVEVIWAGIEEERPADQAELDKRLDRAVPEIVAKQREAGIDVVSDGELSKPGFSNYINDRFTGFEGRAEFQADDVADYPNLAMRLFNTPAMAHLVFANCVDEVTVKDPDAVRRDVERLKSALGDTPPDQAFMGAISPGQIAFNFPDHHYGDPREVPRGARRGAAPRVQGDHRRGLQPADRLARPRDGRALPVGRVEHPELGDAPAAGDRGPQRGARRHPRGAGPPPRLLGQLRGPAPQGRAAARHRRAGVQGERGDLLRRGRQPAPRARVGGLQGGRPARGQGPDPRRHRRQGERGRAPAARRPAAHPPRRGRRSRERPGRHRLRLRHVHPLLPGATRTSCGSSCRRSPRAPRSRRRSSGASGPTAAASRRRRRGSRR